MSRSGAWRLSSALLVLALSALRLPSQESVGYLYWTVNSDAAVWQARIGDSSAKRLMSERSLRHLAYDTVNGKIYFGVSSDTEQLWRANLDGSGQEHLLEVAGQIRDIALDLGGGRAYWAEASPGSAIRRAALDGGGVETLVTEPEDFLAVDLDLTAPEPRMYFVRDSALESARLDGSDRTLVIDSLSVRDLSVDEANDKLYFATSIVEEGVQRSELDGSNQEILVDDDTGRGIEVIGASVYFGHGSPLTIDVMNLDGSGRQEFLSPEGLLLDWSLDLVNGHLYSIDNNYQLQRRDVDGANLIGLASGFSDAHDVAVAQDGTLFVSDPNVEGIVTKRPGDPGLSRLSVDPVPFDDARGLVLDEPAGHLYWVAVDAGLLGRIDTDGSNLSELITGLDAPHDIALDPIAGKLYWTDNIDSTSGPFGALRSANLDGSGVEDVLKSLPQSIRGLDVDPLAAQLYWTDHSLDQIERVDTDGTNQQTVVAADNPHDVAIDTQAGKIYWTEGIADSDDPTGKIRRANLDGSDPEDLLTGLPAHIRDLTLVYLPTVIFADGFESGDTAAWSVSVP